MRSPTESVALLAALLAFFLATGAPLALARDGASRSWSQEKCARYGKAWMGALARRGTKGLGREFLDRHEAFLASGCTAKADVCPRSAEELDMANVMVILAMNAGTASTFLPFSCRRS